MKTLLRWQLEELAADIEQAASQTLAKRNANNFLVHTLRLNNKLAQW